jgi:uncharacterized protein
MRYTNVTMRLNITAKPKSKKEYIKRIEADHYIVAVNEPPVSGKANQSIIKSLSKYFKLPISQIEIVMGEFTKHKVVEISINQDELEKIELSKNPQKNLFN